MVDKDEIVTKAGGRYVRGADEEDALPLSGDRGSGEGFPAKTRRRPGRGVAVTRCEQGSAEVPLLVCCEAVC